MKSNLGKVRIFMFKRSMFGSDRRSGNKRELQSLMYRAFFARITYTSRKHRTYTNVADSGYVSSVKRKACSKLNFPWYGRLSSVDTTADPTQPTYAALQSAVWQSSCGRIDVPSYISVYEVVRSISLDLQTMRSGLSFLPQRTNNAVTSDQILARDVLKVARCPCHERVIINPSRPSNRLYISNTEWWNWI